MGSRDKTGAHFEVSEQSLDEQSRFAKLPLRDREIEFLKAAFATRLLVGQDLFTSVELVEQLNQRGLPVARATIDRYCRNFSELGVFDATFRKFGETRSVKRRLWRLRDINDVEKDLRNVIHPQARSAKNPILRSKRIRESNTQYLNTLENATPRSENFWFGFLDRCMARSATEKIPGNVIVSELPFQNERVIIETSTQTHDGARLAAWTDKPVMRALLTQILGLIEDRLMQGQRLEELQNAFPIDLVDIAELMSLEQPHNTGNHERIFSSISALESTRFDVKLESDPSVSEFMKYFNLNQGDTPVRESHFRFIGHVDILDDMDHQQAPRKLVVSLGVHLWHRIQNNAETKAIFRSHQVMLSTKVSGVMHVLYDYLRPVIYKVKNKPERTINRPLQHFAATLVPTIEYSEFKKKLIAGLKAHSKGIQDDWNEDSEDPLEVLFCGYFITIFRIIDPEPEYKTKDNLIIQVQRDPKDPIIGDQSKKISRLSSGKGPNQSALF
jgi:hypothetical protein